MSVCDTPYFVKHSNPAMGLIPVPCGKCPPCLFRRVNSWVFRLLQEDKVSSSAVFATLTYAIHSVPISSNGWPTLRPEDFRLYIKRLRKACKGVTIRYYVAGEYGTINGRPHYHAIIFNVPPDRLNLITDCWSLNGVSIGGVHVGNVSGDSIAYTLKYLDKGAWFPKHRRDDRYPEFARNSKNLGASYLTPEIVGFHRADPSRLFCSLHEGHRVAMPRYYKRKIFSEDEVKAQLPYIQSVLLERERLGRIDFAARYPNADFTYEDIIEERKRGRYYSFHLRQQIKSRKL